MNKKENNKKKVFVVSCGADEDYFVVAMFSTKEDALAYLDWNDDTYQLEEWELDEPYERVPHLYWILLNVKEDKITARIAYGFHSEAYKGAIRYDGSRFYAYIESDSKSRAKKEAKERFRYVLENEQAKFPYLRVKAVRHTGDAAPAYFDYDTGEMLVPEDSEIVMDLPDFVMIRKIKP